MNNIKDEKSIIRKKQKIIRDKIFNNKTSHFVLSLFNEFFEKIRKKQKPKKKTKNYKCQVRFNDPGITLTDCQAWQRNYVWGYCPPEVRRIQQQHFFPRTCLLDCNYLKYHQLKSLIYSNHKFLKHVLL